MKESGLQKCVNKLKNSWGKEAGRRPRDYS